MRSKQQPNKPSYLPVLTRNSILIPSELPSTRPGISFQRPSSLANIYFLVAAALQCILTISSLSPAGSDIAPFIVIIVFL